jgi:ABC-type Na+ efflux pump permease subunit
VYQVLTLANREISRLSQRFRGAASPLVVLLLLGAIGFTAFSLRDALTPGSGLYRVGVSGEPLTIQDSRFSVMQLNAAQGQLLLDEGAIDVWIDGTRLVARPDDRSQYAEHALNVTLKKQEVQRIGSLYAYDRAFPLRVGIYLLNPLPTSEAGANAFAQTNPDSSLNQPDEVIIPSLTPPPAPFVHVLLALVYILPVTFISIFFTSSFMDEKINRRLTILLSTPASPFQIILGKMLPYLIFATVATALIAVLTHASVPLAIAIFTPATLFIFAIYLLVPLFYRTFKDTTFISMLVTTLSTAYLVFPAMFTGTSELAYLSPLALAVKMYRGEPFGWREYLFPSLPMLLVFGLSLYAGTRLLNEEFLMAYRDLTRKILDAVYLVLQRSHPFISIGVFSLLLVPVVYLGQVVIVVFASNLPGGLILGGVLVAAALVEECVKSVGIFTLVEKGDIHSVRGILGLAFLSAAGFLISEKLLVLLSVSAVSQIPLAGFLFNTGGLFLVPLAAHFIFTAAVCLLAGKTRLPYRYALLLVAVVHALYNYVLIKIA